MRLALGIDACLRVWRTIDITFTSDASRSRLELSLRRGGRKEADWLFPGFMWPPGAPSLTSGPGGLFHADALRPWYHTAGLQRLSALYVR